MTPEEEAEQKRIANRERMAKVRAAKKKKPLEFIQTTSHDKSDPYEGLTQRSCCRACREDHCVITGAGFCGNPAFGAMQPAFMTKPDAVERYQQATKYLAKQQLEAKYAVR